MRRSKYWCWCPLLLLLVQCASEQQQLMRQTLTLLDSSRLQNLPVLLDFPPSETVQAVVRALVNRLQCSPSGQDQCVKCLQPSAVLNFLGNTTQTDLDQLSVVLTLHVLTFRTICQTSPVSGGLTCQDYDACKLQLLHRLGQPDQNNTSSEITIHSVEGALHDIKLNYAPIVGQTCFGAESLFSDLNVTDNDVLAERHFLPLARLLFSHILKGDCIDIDEGTAGFMEFLFQQYGDNKSEVITESGLQKLLLDLKIGHDHGNSLIGDYIPHDHHEHGHAHEPDHDHDHNHDHTHSAEHEDTRNSTSPEDGGPTPSGYYFIGSVSIAPPDKQPLQENTLAVANRDPENADGQYRYKRHTTHSLKDYSQQHGNATDMCLSSRELLHKFTLVPNGSISRKEFLLMCPALIQQVVSGVCDHVDKVATPASELDMYGYGSLAVAIISLCSLVGIILLPVLAKRAFRYIMMGFIGLSFGSMAGDAMLHLIPQSIGLHSHDAAEEEHIHSDINSIMEEIPSYLWTQLGILGAIYGLFLFESIVELLSKSHSHQSTAAGHGHSHIPEKLPNELTLKSFKRRTESNQTLATSSVSTTTLNLDNPGPNLKQEPMLKSTPACCGMTSLALVITLGGSIHNFGDGLAIGAAFSTGVKGGLSTSLAVLFHELPHEFGDFVVLLSTGMSVKKALLVNFLSALVCFIGLYIGIQLGENDVARSWILTATAGVFLYVALADMLPELKSTTGESVTKTFLVKNIGILTGIGIMTTIAIFEDHLVM